MIHEALDEALSDSVSCHEIPYEHNQREHEVDDWKFFESLRSQPLGVKLGIVKQILRDNTEVGIHLNGKHVTGCECGGVFYFKSNKCDKCDYQVDYSTIPF